MTTWERPELPAYPGSPGAAKPLKHRLPADKRRVTHGPLDRFFKPTASTATSAPSSATPSTSADVATSSSSAAVVDCTPLPAKRRRRSAEEVLARPKRVHRSARDKVDIMTYADEYEPGVAADHFKVASQSSVSRWQDNRTAIEKQEAKASRRKCTLHPGRRSQYHDLEGRLPHWLLRRRQRRFAVTKGMLIRQATHWSSAISDLTPGMGYVIASRFFF